MPQSPTSFGTFGLIFAIVMGAWTWWCVRRGTIGIIFHFTRREDNPFFFWLVVVVWTGGAIIIGLDCILILIGLAMPSPP